MVSNLGLVVQILGFGLVLINVFKAAILCHNVVLTQTIWSFCLGSTQTNGHLKCIIVPGPSIMPDGIIVSFVFYSPQSSNCRPIVVTRANLEETTPESPGSLRVVSPRQ